MRDAMALMVGLLVATTACMDDAVTTDVRPGGTLQSLPLPPPAARRAATRALPSTNRVGLSLVPLRRCKLSF